MKAIVVTILLAGFAAWARCGEFTPEEQALLDRHLVMEVHLPEQHSGHKIVTMTGPTGKRGPVLAVIFGKEDDAEAKRAGKIAAAMDPNPDAAVQSLLTQARKRYPHSPYFVKCYMDVAATAYNSLR